jgi:YVTN family beta-propeller protein
MNRSTRAPALAFVAALLIAAGAQARDSGQVFVSSEKDNALAVVDAARGEVSAAIPICKRPRHLQLGPDRSKLFVACSDGNHIAVWDIAARKVVDKLDVGADPEMFDISPDGRMLYASNEEDSALTAYDLVAHRKLFEVKVGGEPEGVKVSADGKTVYVASEAASMVHVVDVASRKVVKNIAVGKRPRRFLLTPAQLWVTNELGASVSVIALADHAVQATIDFKPPGMRSEDVTARPPTSAWAAPTMWRWSMLRAARCAAMCWSASAPGAWACRVTAGACTSPTACRTT